MTETAMITLKKIKQKYSANSFQVDMKMDCCKKEKKRGGGAKKSFLAVKLDVHMTNFKGCQNKKKSGGEEERVGKKYIYIINAQVPFQ